MECCRHRTKSLPPGSGLRSCFSKPPTKRRSVERTKQWGALGNDPGGLFCNRTLYDPNGRCLAQRSSTTSPKRHEKTVYCRGDPARGTYQEWFFATKRF